LEHSGFWLSDYGENAIYVSRGTPSGEAKMMGSRRHLQLGVWPRYSLLFPKRASVAIQNNTHIIWLVLTHELLNRRPASGVFLKFSCKFLKLSKALGTLNNHYS
jgi:hypothetical protein